MNRVVKVVASVAMLVLISGSLYAQGPGIAVGLKSGVNVADIRFSDDTETSSRIGFIGGGVLSIMPSPIFAIQPEILYSQQGSKASDVDGDVTLEVDYIQVPVLIKITVPTTSQVTPMFYAGPVFSFESKCALSGELGGVSAWVNWDDPSAGVARETTDVGVNFGAGLNFDVGTSAFISLEGRANIGLKDLDPDDVDTAKNQVFSFLIGFGVNLR